MQIRWFKTGRQDPGNGTSSMGLRADRDEKEKEQEE